MVRSCERAVRIGLPALVFSEHFDFDDAWRAGPEDFPPASGRYIDDRGYLTAPVLDVHGYLESVDRCRHQFPDLQILTGVEFGQPHLFESRARQLIDLDQFDRINGSLHTLAMGPDRAEPVTLFRLRPAADVIWAYLEEIPRMVAGSDVFEVFTHIDYPIRHWPEAREGPFDPRVFEEGFRTAMRAIADSGRALEMNTRRLWSWIPQWWQEEGGQAVSFGSDAHVPELLAHGFPEAMHMVDHVGFRPGASPEDFWNR